MKSAPKTKDEKKRLAKLNEYNVLDTLPEQSFDDLTAIASYICETPIALVSLIDENRQWFKSHHGLDATETPRDVAFCAHAIHGDEVFHIPDATKDARFHDNPLVTGAPHVIFYAGAPIVSPEGHALGTLCVIDNHPKELNEEQKDALTRLSRQVADQLEFRLAAAKAEQASVAKSQFMANMSHELRTPLNAIIGYSELLTEELESDDENNLEDIKKIHSSGKHLLSLINQILDLSKVEAGKMDVYKEPAIVMDIAEEVKRIVSPLVTERGNRLEFELSEAPTVFETDIEKYKQILINLLSNAGKFTENGSVTVKIYQKVEDNTHRIITEVRDTGIGIAEDKFKQIFKEFTQADGTTTRDYGGTGLGLSICKSYAELLGGEISVSSTPGKGTCFTLNLPINENASVVSLPSVSAKLKEAKGKPILIIDDEALARELTARSIQSADYQIFMAQSGDEGIRLASEIMPAVILLDVMMPGKDGWATLNELKENPKTRNIPVVMMSVVPNQEVGFSLGASDFLVKPVKKDRLLECVQKQSKPQSGKVLVVDDDPIARELAGRALEKAGIPHLEAKDGKEALKHFEGPDVPALVLLDLMMPHMDGFEFLSELEKRGLRSKTEVIVLTAKTLASQDRKELNDRVAKVASKAKFTPSKLLKDIQKLIRKDEAAVKKAA